MSLTYLVGIGHDVALVSLSAIDPQPRCEGLKTTRRTYGADSTLLDEGRYLEFEFDFLEDEDAYQDVLDQFGIHTVTQAEVTIYAKDEVYDGARLNGVAVRPLPGVDIGWNSYFLRNIKILVRDLFLAS